MISTSNGYKEIKILEIVTNFRNINYDTVLEDQLMPLKECSIPENCAITNDRTFFDLILK